MTTKCANPACDHPFHYFRSGRIYLIDMAGASGAVRSTGARGMKYFWLCGRLLTKHEGDARWLWGSAGGARGGTSLHRGCQIGSPEHLGDDQR